MSDRHKYAYNFFENAREHMERNDFPRIPIGTIGGIDGWYLTMRRKIIKNEVNYYPFIYTNKLRPEFKFRKYFNIRKNDGSSDIYYKYFSHLGSTSGSTGKYKTVDELLNEENGYLTNGGIIIEYGFQIEGILDRDKIWTFNFHDPLFDYQEQSNMITFHKDSKDSGTKSFHCHKQLLTHNSTYFDSNFNENQMIELTNEDLVHFNHFLQFSHGVRVGADSIKSYYALMYAQKYKLFNVIQLIDQRMVLREDDVGYIFPHAISFDLKQCFAKFLKAQKTSKKLAEQLKYLDLKTMTTGETMKKCVKRFFEF